MDEKQSPEARPSGEDDGREAPSTQGSDAARAQETPMAISRQYIKDLSFENPNAPLVYSSLGNEGPEIKLNVELSSNQLGDRAHEVVVGLTVNASKRDQAIFILELVYAGIVVVGESLSAEQTQQILKVDAPRHLFPFIRAIVADATREGGFPPLLLNPIDFARVYRRQRPLKGRAAAAEI